MPCILTTVLLGIAAAARKMKKKTRWLYRHLDEFKTEIEQIDVKRVYFDDITGKPVKVIPF
jgi:hypothetical protein